MGNATSSEEAVEGNPLEASFDASELQIARAVFDVLSAEESVRLSLGKDTEAGSPSKNVEDKEGATLGLNDSDAPKLVGEQALKVRDICIQIIARPGRA